MVVEISVSSCLLFVKLVEISLYFGKAIKHCFQEEHKKPDLVFLESWN